MKFTGHERDLRNPSSEQEALDYMHGRNYSALTGRFLSVDRAGGRAQRPQSWNRYAYVHGNPLAYVDPTGLDPLPANLAQFFGAFFGADFSHVDVQTGLIARMVTRIAGSAGGVTIASTISLNPRVAEGYTARNAGSLGLVGHELTHVLQYEVLGVNRFLQAYLQEYNYNRTQGQSDDQAYRNIIQEEVAYRVQGVLDGFLVNHQEIAEKLESGQSLNQEELNLVSNALSEAAKNGEFKTGFQFIQGFLVYVAPPQ